MSDRAKHYEKLTNTHNPIEAAAVAQVMGEENLAAKYLVRHRSKFNADERVGPLRAIEQKKYIQWALSRNASPEDIIICGQAMGEGSFMEKALKQLMTSKSHTRVTRSATSQKKASKGSKKM